MDTAIADLPQIMLSLEQAQKLIFGQRIKLEQPPAAALYRIYDENSRFPWCGGSDKFGAASA